VLQKAVDNTGDADVVTDALDAWPDTAHAPHDQLDLHASLAGGVEQCGNGFIHQVVEFDLDQAATARAGVINLALDQPLHFSAGVDGGYQQVIQPGLAVTGFNKLEDAGGFVADLLVGGKE